MMLHSLTPLAEVPCSAPRIELVNPRIESKYLYPDPKSNKSYSYTFVPLREEYLKVVKMSQAAAYKKPLGHVSQEFNVSQEQVTLNLAATALFDGTKPMEGEALMVLRKTIKRTSKRSPRLPHTL
jgi:hypothetical protein